MAYGLIFKCFNLPSSDRLFELPPSSSSSKSLQHDNLQAFDDEEIEAFDDEDGGKWAIFDCDDFDVEVNVEEIAGAVSACGDDAGGFDGAGGFDDVGGADDVGGIAACFLTSKAAISVLGAFRLNMSLMIE